MSSLTSGFRASWAARRPLGGVLLLAMTAYLLTVALLDLFTSDDDLVILDGNPQPAVTWIRFAAVGLLWAAGLLAAARVVHRPEPRTVAGFAVAGVAGPVLLLILRALAGPVPYADRFLDALLLAAVLAVQAGAVARRSAEPVPERPGPIGPTVALVIAGVLTVGMAVQNPYQAPVIRTGPGVGGRAVAVAWPAGQHPVIVTIGGVRYCDDDLCTGFHGVTGSPAAVDGYSTVSIGGDGTVVKAATTGGEAGGGPFLQYARCARAGCRTSYLPIRTSAEEKPDPAANIEVAGASAPDGALWFFVAAPVSGPRYRISLIRCAEVTCANPERHPLGTAERNPADGYPDRRRVRLGVGPDGRPAAAFWAGHQIVRYSCDPVTCARPQQTVLPAIGTAWATSAERTLSFQGDRVWDGVTMWRLGELATGGSGTIVADRSGVYAAAAVVTVPQGLHVTIGGPQEFRRETVWRCAGSTCTGVGLDTYAGDGRPEMLAVGSDGRVLVVREDRTVLLDGF